MVNPREQKEEARRLREGKVEEVGERGAVEVKVVVVVVKRKDRMESVVDTKAK